MIAIKASHITKVYKLYDKPTDRLKESLYPWGKRYHKDFHALKDVSFTVNKGETLGIVGKNGSGKSTLLKIITGVLNPTLGGLEVNGKISALLELGAGFNPDYTGLENIYLNGTIMGLTKEEMNHRMDDILSFADIGEFINQPVKVYSSGMFVRLAFAVAIHIDPEILIIDEALSVGDMRFQQKCYRKIEEFKETKTILFVSHDLTVINKYCNRAIWINEGELLADGVPKEISKMYQAYMMGSSLTKLQGNNQEHIFDNAKLVEVDPLDESLDVFGDNKARITGISMVDVITGQKTTIVEPGQPIKLMIKLKANEDIEAPIIGFDIKDRLGNTIAQSNSYVQEAQIDYLEKDLDYGFVFEFSFPDVNQGQYLISPAVASGTQEDHIQHSWVHDALIINVLPVQKHQLSGLLIMKEVKFYSLN